MGVSRGSRLRVGVIGLGRLWEARHKPALARMRDRFQVAMVYDHVARRAAMEAHALRCEVAGGLAAMIDRDDIEAIYLLSPQWFGLHPIDLACAAGKPIYCALPPLSDPEGLESLASSIRAAGTPFMPELARRFYPASLRLRELLATRLGKARLVLGHTRLFGFDRYGPPGPSTQLTPLPLDVDPGSNLLDWCRYVFQEEPTGIQARECRVMKSPEASESGPDFASYALEFSDGRGAQMEICRYHRSPWGDATQFLPRPGFQVFAENGAAWLEMPDRVQWTDASGTFDERLPMEPSVGEMLNDQFHRMVHGEPSMAPTIDDALAVVKIGRDLRKSLQEGRRVGEGSP